MRKSFTAYGAFPLDFASVQEGDLIEVQIAPMGRLLHEDYGPVDVTEEKIDALVKYFNTGPASEIVTDYNHGSSKPRASAEGGKASGWLRKVYKKAGEGAFAMWKATKAALNFVKNEEYRYFSPTLAWDYTDPETGKIIPLALRAAGLTNRPFFESMKPIEFSSVSDGDGPTAEWYWQPEDDRTFQQTKTEDGVSFPAAAYAYVPDPESPSTWKLRLWEDPQKKVTARQVGAAIAALGKGFRGQKVQIPADARAGVIAKVRAAWRKANPDKAAVDMPRVLHASSTEENMNEFLKLLMEKLGDKVDEKHFSAIEIKDDEEVKPEVVLDAIVEVVTEFSTTVTDLTKEKKDLEKKLATSATDETKLADRVKELEANSLTKDVNAALDTATKATKIKAADRDFWEKRLRDDFEGVSEYLEKKDSILDTKPKGSGEDVEGRTAEEEFSALIKEKQEKDKELSYSDAMREVVAENQDLAKRYREETYARIDGKDV